MDSNEKCLRCGGGPRGLYGKCLQCFELSDAHAAVAKMDREHRAYLDSTPNAYENTHGDERCEMGCWECVA